MYYKGKECYKKMVGVGIREGKIGNTESNLE